MNLTRDVGRVPLSDAPERFSSSPIRILRVTLLPASLILWAIGISKTNVANLSPYGLPVVLPLIFYAGIALLLLSVGIELAQTKLSEIRLGAHAVSLAVMLYGTGALVYKDGRYSWLYKTVGVVQYVAAHGSLNRSIDIYQSWPGFFALAAWFDNVAGVGTSLDYAKWAQLIFELAIIPLLYTIYQSISLPPWHRWVGIMLYLGSNWIAQDYFSPQAMSTVLSLGIMALVTRWMFVVNYRTPQRRRIRAGESPESISATLKKRELLIPSLRRSAPFIVALTFLFFALVESHELSPYIIVIQLALLSITGLVRPRWVALVAAVVALGYLLPNFSYVNSHYGLTSSIGNFFGNLETPGISAANAVPTPKSHKFIADCTFLLSAGMWGLALAGAWLRRKARRIVMALLLLTYSPILVLVGGGYGQEGILRVYLFSLPWAAALAACALAPLRPTPNSHRVGASPANGDRGTRTKFDARAGRGGLRAVLPLAIAIALFFPSFYGDDSSNEMPQNQVDTLLAFQASAAPGPVLTAIESLPFSDLANYNQWPVGTIFGPDGGVMGNDQVTPSIATYLALTMVKYTAGQLPSYIIITPSQEAYNQAFGITAPSDINVLLASLAKSPYWTPIINRSGVLVYQLSHAASKIKSGPYQRSVSIAVP